MTAEWTELSYLQKQSSQIEQFRDLQQNPFSAFALGVVLVFFVLAGLYESWSLPLAVILVVPMCLFSALGGVALARMDVNIFVQVGFVVLVGLAAKNAILIVEFARDRQQEGATRFDAAVEAARVRLRPILMTSFAFILGVFPLVIAHGAGAEMRRTLGTAVFAGMIGVTLFGIFLTPVFFYVIRRFSGPPSPAPQPAHETHPADGGRILVGGNLRRGSAVENHDGCQFVIWGKLSGATTGGRSSGRCPQAGFGFGPIFSTNSPPAASSAWLNQDRVRGLPLSVADWTYMFCAELSSAMIVKVRPL